MSLPWTEEQWAVFEARFWRVMAKHIGKGKAISATRLFEQVTGKPPRDAITGTRFLRKLIERLEWQGAIICSSTAVDGSGYFLPSSDSEKAEHFHRGTVRALKILKKQAIQKDMDLAARVQQLVFDLHGEA